MGCDSLSRITATAILWAGVLEYIINAKISTALYRKCHIVEGCILIRNTSFYRHQQYRVSSLCLLGSDWNSVLMERDSGTNRDQLFFWNDNGDFGL